MVSTSHVIHSDPDILGGTPVFVSTRVPVKTLLDYLEAGDSLNEFLDHFPSVSREKAIALTRTLRERSFGIGKGNADRLCESCLMSVFHDL